VVEGDLVNNSWSQKVQLCGANLGGVQSVTLGGVLLAPASWKMVSGTDDTDISATLTDNYPYLKAGSTNIVSGTDSSNNAIASTATLTLVIGDMDQAAGNFPNPGIVVTTTGIDSVDSLDFVDGPPTLSVSYEQTASETTANAYYQAFLLACEADTAQWGPSVDGGDGTYPTPMNTNPLNVFLVQDLPDGNDSCTPSTPGPGQSTPGSGQWMEVSESQNAEVPRDQTGSGDLELQTTGVFGPQQPNTLNIPPAFFQNIAVLYSGTSAFSDDQSSPPFAATLVPDALIQLDVLPYTIVYQPPGNQSTASYTMGTGYSTSASLSSTEGSSTVDSSELSWTLQESLTAGFPTLGPGIKATVSNTNSWDTTTAHGYGDNFMASNSNLQTTTQSLTEGPTTKLGYLIPGKGLTCPGISGPPPKTGIDYEGQVAGTGTVAGPSCTAPVSPPNTYNLSQCPNCSNYTSAYFDEPFWSDQFTLLVHPQFAVYDLGGTMPQDVMVAGAATVTISVQNLWDCATGDTPGGVNECVLYYQDPGYPDCTTPVSGDQCLVLASGEASRLLALDPFWYQGQNVNLSSLSSCNRALPETGGDPGSCGGGGSLDYGAAWQPNSAYSFAVDTGLPPQTVALATTHAFTSTQSNALNYTSSLTNVVGNTQSAGVTIGGLKGMSGGSVTVTNSDKNTQGATTTVSYSDSTAVTNIQVTMASATLGDFDTTTPNQNKSAYPALHFPLPTNDPPIATGYLDRMFGTLLFTDINAPGPPQWFNCSRPVLCGMNVNSYPYGTALTAFYRVLQADLSVVVQDVPPSAPDGTAVRFAVGSGLMSTVQNGDFQPSGDFIQADLVHALSVALKITTEQAHGLLADSKGGGSSVVRGQELIDTLARGFGMTESEAAQLVMSAYSGGAVESASTAGFNGAVVNRGPVASVFLSVMENRCLAGCAFAHGKFTTVLPYPKPQSISFPSPASGAIAPSTVTVSASASSGLPVSFASLTPGVCESSGTNGEEVQLVSAGVCALEADQVGNRTYGPAESVDASFSVTSFSVTG
jgi:hypothetical protein